MQPILYSYRRIKLLYNCITVKMSLQWQNAFFQLYTIIFIVSTFVFSHKNLSCKIFRKLQLKAFLKLSSHKIRSVRKSFKPEFTKRKLKHNARLLANTWLDKDKINEDEEKYQPNFNTNQWQNFVRNRASYTSFIFIEYLRATTLYNCWLAWGDFWLSFCCWSWRNDSSISHIYQGWF